MSTSTAPPTPRKILIRVTPEVRQALKVAAAEKGMFMEHLLHEILCREFDRPDLADRPPSNARRGGGSPE